MTSWAIGRNDGSTKENAIEYDWENGVLHFESEGTRWYRLDLAPLYYADSLCLSITNTSNTESVNVVCQATVRFPVQDVVFNSDSIKQTLAPLSTYNGWVLRRELVSARVTEMFFTVSSTGTVKLSWQAFFPTGESCEEAKHGCDYEQEAGTTWYKLYAPYPDERTNLESIVISFEEQGASNTISAIFKTDCNSSVIRTKTFNLYNSLDTVVFPAEYLASLGWPDLLLSCTSSANCYVDYEFVYYGTSCSKPIDLDWEQGNNHPAGKELWYKLELMNPDIVPEENDLRIHFENLSQENNSAHINFYFDCKEPAEIHRDYTLYANDEKYLDVTRDVLEVMGWPNFYINYQSDYDSRIRLELIPKHPKDTFVTYDTAYVCQGDAFYTWREYIIEEPTFWTDTIDTILVGEYRIMDVDVFHNYAVYPFREPRLYTMEELDVLPVVEKGIAIDASSATDALLAKFHNANIAYYPGGRPMDVTNVKWQVQTGNGWQDMPYTVPENAASVIMRYVVTTECETELTSADFVFNLSFSSDILTVAQALEIGAGLATDASTDKQYTIRGYVSSIITPFSEQYENQSFYIADDSLSTANSKANGGFYIYRGKPATGVAIREGALVELTTAIRNYKDENIENAEQNVLVTVLKEGPECHILSGTCGENLTWTANYCDSVLTISGTGEIENYASQTSVPWYSFKSIFKSIVIEDGVTSIGDYAFIGCRNLASVEIPNSVTSIGEKAFDGCRSLTSVTIPNSVTNIGYTAFASCSSLTSIEIPNSVTNIGSYAFSRCSGLTSVTIPNSVTSVGYFVFYDCSSLTSIIVDANNANYCSLNGVLFNKNITTLIQYPGGKQGAYTIPNAITSIEIQAFSYSSLTSIEIPSSVTNIGEFAFSHCSSLTSVTNYATTPQTIDLNVFDDVDISACTLYVPAESVDAYKAADVWKEFGNILPIGDTPEPCILASGTCGAEGDNLTWTLTCDSVLTISGIGAMADYEWNNAEQTSNTPWNSYREMIKFISFNEGLTSIGARAFEDCSSLTSIEIPNSVTSIGNAAFAGCHSSTSVTIGNSVTSIGDDAFNWCNGLTSIEIPNSVTSIGGRAFVNCLSLTSVTISNGVTNIGNYTFASCRSLTSIELPNSITSIGSFTFSGCSGLLSVTIPNSVTNIWNRAFEGCSNLTSVTIPNSVTSIGNYAFYECFSLTSIEIPNSVTSIGDEAFERCSGLISASISNGVTSIGDEAFGSCSSLTLINVADDNPNYCSVEGVLFNKDQTLLIQYPCGKQGAYAIPNSTTHIGHAAFRNCSGLTSVKIPNSVTSIEGGAFWSCSNLLSVTIPNSVTSIGQTAFAHCGSLTSVTCESATPTPSEGNAFYNVDKSTCILYVPAESVNAYKAADVWKEFGIILPIGDTPEPCILASGTCGAEGDNLTWTLSCDSVLTISGTGEMAYYEWNYTEQKSLSPWYSHKESITSIVIEDGVTSIGHYAFMNCSALTSVTIGNSVTSIGWYAFSGCSGLTSVTIPNRVTSIESGAFSGCSGLTSVTIPNSVTSIGSSAFKNCTGLTSVTIPNSVTSIGGSAFSSCTGLTSVTIPNSVTSIGHGAFYRCSSLTSVTIPSSVTSIGDEAFFDCIGLTSVTIGNSVTSIGWSAFDGCSNITSVTWNAKNCNRVYFDSQVESFSFGNEVEIIPDQICSNMEKLTSMTIGNSVTSIEYGAFSGCSGLTSVTIPNSVTSIGQRAFDGCSGLTSVEIPNSVTSIGDDAFFDCIGLTSVTIGNSVTSIGERAFYECRNLTSVTIPNNVTSIGEQAFFYCSSLISLTIPNSVTSIGDGAFADCSSLTSVTIPSSVTSIGDWAFARCSGLTSVTNYATTPQAINANVFDNMDISACTLYVPAQSYAAYKSVDVWKEFGNIEMIEEGAGLSCDEDSKFILFDWQYGFFKVADKDMWCLMEMDESRIPEDKDLRLHIQNQSSEANNISIEICRVCQPILELLNVAATAGQDSALTIPRDWIEGIGWSNWELKVSSDKEAHIWAELVEPIRHDTIIVDQPVWYMCDGESYIDDITGKSHMADSSDPSSLQWSDTIEGGFNAERNMFVDTIYHFQIVIPTAPTLPAISDVLPTLEVKKGEVIDVTAANAALVAVLDNGGDESKQAVKEIHWEYSTDGATFTEIDATPVTTETFSVRYRVITECDIEYISTEVLNQTSGTEPATYTINFINYDGSVIDSRAWEEGTMPACAEPTKTDDDYIYCFAGWQPQIKTVTETATYQATYDVCGGWLSESVSWRYQGDTLVVFGNGVIPDYEQGTAPWNGFERTVHVVYVADGISRIGEWAFADMSMSVVRIPESVTVIGADAFKGSSSIESVYYEGFDYQWTAINFVNEYSNPMFYGTNLYAKETPVNKLTVSSTDIISANAFIGITAVEVASIETWCAVTITHTETSYEPSFDLIVDGVIVTDVCLQEGVTQINPFVFKGCRSLQSVCIPASMQQIGEDAFSHTPNLTKVLYAGSLEQWCNITFANAEANPACHADLYFGEDKLGTRIEIPASLTSIRAFAFPNKETLDVYFQSHDPSGYMLNSFGEPQEVGNKHFFVPCGTTEDYQHQLNYDASLFTENYTFHYQVLTSQEPMGNVQIVHAPDCEDQRLVIEAIPTNGYQFKLWSDGNTENPRTLVLTQDTTLSAAFESIAVEQDTTFIHDGENTDLDGDMETVIVQPGGELNINASGVSIGVLVITADGIHSGQIHHGELPITADHIYLEYILNPWGTTASPNRWYAFAVPFEVDINGGISRSCDNKPLVSGTDFLILEYNGLWRALQGKGWSKKLDGTLEPGNFYMLGIDGTCNRWRFEKKSGRPFEGAAHMPYNDYASGNPKDAGWNGRGNTRLEYSGMNMGGAGIEYMVTYDNRFGKYETHRIEEMDLFVGQPFFIQAEHDGFFDFQHKGSPYLMAARNKKAPLPMMHLTLTNENNTAGTDHLYLTLHEDTDGGYTIGRDVIRMSTDCKTAAQLWCTAEDGTQLSAHGIAEPQTETVVPVEFFVPKDGEYQLEMSARAMDGYEVELLHNGTHAATLSDAQPVTIDLSAGTNNDYSVCVHRKTPTGLDQVPSDKVQCTKVLRDGQLIIIRNGVEYNADGKMLK